MKSTNPPHLTRMDFAEILSSQFSHQAIIVLKILSSYHAHFQNFDCIHYGPFNPNTKPLQFLAFPKCSYSTSFNSKLLKILNDDSFLGIIYNKNTFYACGGMLKLSSWPLQYFFSHFHFHKGKSRGVIFSTMYVMSR